MTKLRRKLPGANALFVFEAAARCGSFTRAAAELGVTQPAVSRMLSRLEQHLDVRLFERSPNGISLTEEGKILYRQVSTAFHDIEAAIDEIEARNNNKETVSLSVSTAFTTHWLMPHMHRFQADHPDIDLRFHLIPGKIGGPVNDVDMGMRFVSGPDEEHDTAMMLPEILIPVCTSDYLQKMVESGSRAGPFANTLVALTDHKTDWFDQLMPDNPSAAENRNRLTLSDYGIVLQAALLGQGVAVGWLNIVCYWLRIGALVPAASRSLPTGRTCHLVWARQRPLRKASRKVKQWVIDQTLEDVAVVNRMYPELRLAEHVETL